METLPKSSSEEVVCASLQFLAVLSQTQFGNDFQIAVRSEIGTEFIKRSKLGESLTSGSNRNFKGNRADRTETKTKSRDKDNLDSVNMTEESISNRDNNGTSHQGGGSSGIESGDLSGNLASGEDERPRSQSLGSDTTFATLTPMNHVSKQNRSQQSATSTSKLSSGTLGDRSESKMSTISAVHKTASKPSNLSVHLANSPHYNPVLFAPLPEAAKDRLFQQMIALMVPFLCENELLMYGYQGDGYNSGTEEYEYDYLSV